MSVTKVYRGHGHGMSIAIEADTRRVLYRYSMSEIDFEFDLLSHVAVHLQPTFKRLLAAHGLEVETYDNATEIYMPHHGYYERLKGEN